MRKFFRIIFIAVLIILLVWLAIFLWPVEKRKEATFNELAENKKEGSPLVIAHRGGAGIAPEGTLQAFDESTKAGADILEFDTHLTADGELVVSHDPSVDRMTNGQGLINEMTLEEIRELDAGYNYKDENGDYSYRGEGIEIPAIREVFEEYPDMLYLIELKDTNQPELYDEVIQEMWALIQEYNMEDQVTIASFDHEINEGFQKVSNGEAAIGAGQEEVTPFVIFHILKLNALADINADSLQLPIEQYGFDLINQNLLDSAEERNIQVFYWTINEVETMRELVEKDVDGIMTDYPDRLVNVMNE